MKRPPAVRFAFSQVALDRFRIGLDQAAAQLRIAGAQLVPALKTFQVDLETYRARLKAAA